MQKRRGKGPFMHTASDQKRKALNEVREVDAKTICRLNKRARFHGSRIIISHAHKIGSGSPTFLFLGEQQKWQAEDGLSNVLTPNCSGSYFPTCVPRVVSWELAPTVGWRNWR